MTDQQTSPAEAVAPPYRKMPTQAFGLALIAGAFAVYLLATLVFQGAGGALMPAVLTIVAALLSWMVWRVDKLWSTIVGLVMTIMAGLGLFFVAFGIFQPFSPVEFVAGLMFLSGVLFALTGGVRSLRRRNREYGPGTRSLRIRQGALVLIGLGALLSIGGFLTNRTTVSAAEAAGATELDMTDFQFVPTRPEVVDGDQLLLHNSDVSVHDFTLDDYDIHVRLVPGSEAMVDLSALPPGTYHFYCSLHSDGLDGMVGTLIVDG